MGQLNAQGIFGAIRGLFSALDVADEALLRGVILPNQYNTTVTDGGTAATTAAEATFWQNTTTANQIITGFTLAAPVAIVGDNTNNAVLTLTRRDAAGINPLVVGTVTTNVATGNFVAFLPKAATLTVANVVLAPGASLTLTLAKGGTGVAIAAATAAARVQLQLQATQ